MKITKRFEIEKIIFIISTLALVMGIGFSLGAKKLFPYPQLKKLKNLVRDEISGPWYYFDPYRTPEELRYVEDQVGADDLTLIARFTEDKRIDVVVVDRQREIVHKWDLDIFRHWPEPENAARDTWPKKPPGALPHGVVALANGDLVFNYERFGLMRVNACAEPIWKLPKYITHHSVHENEDGDFWVSGRLVHQEKLDWLPGHMPGFREEFALKVSPEGEVLDAVSLPRLLLENGYRGLLYLDGIKGNVGDTGDLMHLNDVEEFPASMTPGVFGPGDVVVSLRNNNTVFVFNQISRKIKFMSIGQVTRQHDPDFIDGNRLSIYDNNIVGSDNDGESSEIVLLSAKDGSREIVYPTVGETFFSRAQGKHQWLDNGYLLVTEAQRGRAIEVNEQGEVVWEYVNYLASGQVAGILEATRLDSRFSVDKLQRAVANCR